MHIVTAVPHLEEGQLIDTLLTRSFKLNVGSFMKFLEWRNLNNNKNMALSHIINNLSIKTINIFFQILLQNFSSYNKSLLKPFRSA